MSNNNTMQLENSSYKSITDKTSIQKSKIPKCISSDSILLLEGSGVSFPITTLTWRQKGTYKSIIELTSSDEITILFDDLKRKLDLKRSKMDELKVLCNELNISMTGSKEMLINKIINAEEAEDEACAAQAYADYKKRQK